ncbi:alginate export family protein [Marimonas lutisalis]|uniref:alginate export family protein n=1 Tax=Marimonas lutisalis TaxID=2545756 RepID=UPI001F3B5D35|nr:alginate export family protein [Marimonas lutisalis]
MGAVCLAVFSTVQAQAQDSMVLRQSDGLTVRSHFQAGINLVSERNLFWNFADSAAPGSGYSSDTNWAEFYIKPGLSFENTLDAGGVFYGKLSGVASYTLGTDAYDAGDTGRATLEEAYLGYRTTSADGLTLDFSLGPRELKLGTGMLIANGGSSGFERGALKFGPRKAWEMAAIAKLSKGGFTGTLFYVDPNENPSGDNDNRLAGLDLRFDGPGGGFQGLTYVNVLKSGSPSVQAAPGGIGPPTILPGAREDTQTLSYYARTGALSGPLENAYFAADLAYQWNDRTNLRAWAGRLQAGYTFADLPWAPMISYGFQSFSGDDPNTTRLERFDPLYYEGSPSAWATGSKSSMVFINSNVQSHNLALRLKPGPKDTITFRYAHIRANELFSPIQFGQGTRVVFSNGVPTVISGVTDPHLADDFFVEYSRIINQNTFLTAGVSLSKPGSGITGAVGGNVPNWTGGFLNVVFNF